MITLTDSEPNTWEEFFDDGFLMIKIMKIHTIHKTEI